MKAIKVLFGLIVVLVIVVIIVGSLIANNINNVVQTVVEDIGSETLKTKVTLGKADISLMNSRVLLSNLSIDNPDGFSDAKLFHMDEVVVDIDLMSLLDNTVSVEQMSIAGAKITVEQKGVSTNVQKILDNIDRDEDSPTTDTESESSSSLDQLLVKVASFQFVGSSATLITDQWGKQDLQLAEIKIKDIGGNKGVPVDELVGEIMKPIIKKVKLAAERRLKEVVMEKATEKMQEKTDELKGRVSEKVNKALGEKGMDELKSLFSK